MSVDHAGRLVFAVGHYLGTFYDHDGMPAYARIRIGDQMLCLDGGPELAVWALGNGVPDADPPTTQAAFEEASTQIVGPEAVGVAQTLADDGALVSVRPGTPEAIEFAAGHRLRPLLTAFGELDEHPGRYGIGLGGQVRVHVDAVLFDLWWRCGAAHTLWQACQQVADADDRQPADVFDHFCRHGHTLLAAGAAYLDLATPDPIE